jgi:dTMP kinase
MRTGAFIVVEGLDGSGISTQIARLRRWLANRGVTVEVTKEPSPGPLGAVIRQAIEGRIALDEKVLALAFAADRLDHLENHVKGIRQHLDAGRWVICDRYVLSSLAYQGAADVDRDWLLAINRFALEPDVTIFIETPAEVCAERIELRSSSLELYHDVRQLEKVQQVYRQALADGRLTGSLIRVNGHQKEEAVFRELEAGFERWLGARRPAILTPPGSA